MNGRKSIKWKRTYGSKARCNFVAQLPCIICGQVPSQNAHIRTGGMGRKADANQIVPMCALHHAEYDGQVSGGRATFFAHHKLTMDWMDQMAELTEKLWLDYSAEVPL